jgi:phosphohistidine phosphatase
MSGVEIWILRHCDAEPAGAKGDAGRRLSDAGARHAEEIGRTLAARGLRAARVLTSPLARARQTASLAAAAGLAPGVTPEEEPRLAPGGDFVGLAREVLEEGPLPALLVGHNPDLEGLAFALSGERVAVAKGTFLRIEFEADRGRLVERI